MKTAVIGYGVSGRAAEKLALSLGHETAVFDDSGKGASSSPEGLTVFSPDTIVTSPGVTVVSPLLAKALQTDIPIISELEFAFRNAKRPVLAITGTNGKTTVTELTSHLVNSIGVQAVACGNIGLSLCEAVMNFPDVAFYVVEVSSFQLERTDMFSPYAAAFLNLASDHIDRHGSFEAYLSAKLRIFSDMPDNSVKIINHNLLERFRESGAGEAVTFSAYGTDSDFFMERGSVFFRGRKLIDLEGTALSAPHNAENLMASAALLTSVTGEDALFTDKFRDAVFSFHTGEHRQELFLEKDGIRFVNDSKATNPAAVIAAIDTFKNGKNILLVLGGLDKNMDFSILSDKAENIKSAVLIGESASKIASVLEGKVSLRLSESLEDAVSVLCSEGVPGDVLMLSPGCASMDMFQNYIERGKRFKEAVAAVMGT